MFTIFAIDERTDQATQISGPIKGGKKAIIAWFLANFRGCAVASNVEFTYANKGSYRLRVLGRTFNAVKS